jgi:glycosyltransferase involved in cell wall biosynthesis
MTNIRIYHNNLWARYKGAIFSKVYSGSGRSGVTIAFVQVAETASQRAALGGVDRSYHQYPFELLFSGCYDHVPRYRLVAALTANLLRHREPWGLVVNEALSYGCPVVVSNICGCLPELVREGVTGYSYPFGDIPALCEAMIAAAELSGDRLSVAKQCMDLIGQYTPERAASEILNGCVCITEAPQ